MRKSFVAGALAAALAFTLIAQEKVDLSIVNKIRREAFGQNSKVMDTAFYLTDVYGPRLTGSPNAKAAGEWTVKKMTEWGLVNAKLEAWGPFGRGWAATKYSASMQEPGFQPIIGFALPWSPGTNGPVSGQAIYASITTPEDLDKWRGKLKGKILLATAPHDSELDTEALAHRLTEDELTLAATAPDPAAGNPNILPLGFGRGPIIPPPRNAGGIGAAGGRGRGGAGGGRGAGGFAAQLNKFLKDEGVLVVLRPGAANGAGPGPDGGTIVAGGAGQPTSTDDQLPPPSVAITNEHYNRIFRLLEHNIPVTLQFDIATKFTDSGDSFNVIGEIPGTKPESGIVMLGGHFDSWAGGTGATDNAAGSAVALEAVRILKALNLPMQRTVRIALWTGEEQGLRGSAAYVREHLADSSKPEWSKVSAYYNLDNGSGKIRGIYLQDNEMVEPIFRAWLEPFRDLGATALTIRNTGSTDHVSFDNAGIPGFQFIQDPLEYASRTHHSNMDVYDHLQASDLEQASAVMAWFVYNTATRADMIPRKPVQPGRGGRGQGRGGN